MKSLIIDKENPNGKIVEIETADEMPAVCEDPIREFFEGLASADTNSIAKIRALARDFLNMEGK